MLKAEEAHLKTGNLLNRLILAATIALPTIPVLRDYYPGTAARWMMAQAANEFDRGNPEKAERLLDGAYSQSSDILSDPHFWQQLDRIEESDSSKNSELKSKIFDRFIRELRDTAVRANAAMSRAESLSKNKNFEAAARLLKENLPAREERNPRQNNLLAYMRALAGIELDDALLDIDRALKFDSNGSLLDTKGWVLHRLGRNEEALQILNQALEDLESNWRSNQKLEQFLSRVSEIAGEGTTESDSESKALGTGLDQLLDEFPEVARILPEITDVLAVMHYHRMRIYESLGKTEEMHRELRWLQLFSRKGLDEIY